MAMLAPLPTLHTLTADSVPSCDASLGPQHTLERAGAFSAFQMSTLGRTQGEVLGCVAEEPGRKPAKPMKQNLVCTKRGKSQVCAAPSVLRR